MDIEKGRGCHLLLSILLPKAAFFSPQCIIRKEKKKKNASKLKDMFPGDIPAHTGIKIPKYIKFCK